MSRWTFARRVRSGEYKKLGRALAALPGAEDGPLLDLAGAILSIGGRVCATSTTGLELRKLVEKQSSVLYLAVPESRAGLDGAGCDLRRESHFDQIPITTVSRLPTAGVNWCVMDAARDLDDDQLARVIARVIAKRATSLKSLIKAGHRRGRWNGARRFRRVTSEMGRGFTHSREERYARGLLRTAGMTPHPQPFPFRAPDGRIVAEGDIVFTDELLDIEVDGPHHLLPEQQQKDRRRDRELGVLGVAVARFLTYEIRRAPERFVADVQRLRASRAA